MLINRLKYLIEHNCIDSEKTMIEYGDVNLSYSKFIWLISELSKYIKIDESSSHVYYETNDSLALLIMFYFYTSKDKIFIMLPKDVKDVDFVIEESYILKSDNRDELIYKLIKEKKENFQVLDAHKNLDIKKTKQIFLRAYSSGTSGLRKEIERNYNSWFSAFEIQNEVFMISSATLAYIQGDINYTGNLNYILGVLYAGGSVILGKKKGAKEFLDYLSLAKINNTFLVPTTLGMILRYVNKEKTKLDLSNLEFCIITAGEKLQEYIYKEFKLKFNNSNIIEYYGASEVGHISYSKNDEILIGNGYVGRLFDNVKLKIIDGKIYTYSPYHAIDQDGFVCVGDYGSYKDNNLYVKGRGTNIVSRSGKMIDIEDVRLKVSKELNCESFVFSYKDIKRGENYMLILKTFEDRKSLVDKINIIVDKISLPDKIVLISQVKTKSSGKIDYKYYLEKYGI